MYNYDLKTLNLLLAVIVFLTTISCSGCANNKKINLNINSGKKLNLDSYNRPLPVVIKCYQLSDAKNFDKLNFLQIYKDNINYSEYQITQCKSYMILPSKTYNFRLKKNIKSQYLSCVGFFNKPSENNWRSTIKLENNVFTKNYKITVNNNSIKFVKG